MLPWSLDILFFKKGSTSAKPVSFVLQWDQIRRSFLLLATKEGCFGARCYDVFESDGKIGFADG